MSKIRKNISISEDAAEKLNQQSNASQYIEDLILGKIEREAPWKELEYRIDELKQILKQSPTPSEEVSKPDSAIPEHLLPNCCKTQEKCSHWQYDELNEHWTHKLTGEVKEAM